MVARKVEQFFGRAPIVRINPDEVVALGAAIQAALLDRSRKTSDEAVHRRASRSPVGVVIEHPRKRRRWSSSSRCQSWTPRAVIPVAAPGGACARSHPGTAPAGGDSVPAASSGKPLVFDVPELRLAVRSGARPCATEDAWTTRDAARVNAPEAPAPPPPPMRPRQETTRFGAEVNAPAPPAPAAPPRPPPLLIDVTPLSLGVETVGGFCDVLIDRNTPVPCDKTRTFATATEGQTLVHVRVSQGESRRFSENTCLGELELGIVAGPRGAQEIAVTFEIDADGILNVRARDVATGKETAARMQLAGGQGEAGDLRAMQARQAAHPIAPLDTGGCSERWRQPMRSACF